MDGEQGVHAVHLSFEEQGGRKGAVVCVCVGGGGGGGGERGREWVVGSERGGAARLGQ